ncbi:MAG: divergent polysaccharide deacetylase family protein [Candidatus Omnitrophica bacterium]|nr:divergent polysaccharide deacetylase family protein [Candidatus Omnitrophota bacterium]
MRKYTWLSVIFAVLIIIASAVIVSRILSEDMRGEEKGRAEELHEHGRGLPKLALVLDDFGYTRKNLAGLKAMGIPLTLAVLPDTPYSKAVCVFAGQSGMEIILHLPMEPERKTASLEHSTILADMDEETMKNIISSAFLSIPGAKGVSNHMGSKATKDARVLRIVFGELKKKGVFFLDSRTTDESLCPEIAKDTGITCIKRDVFIDNKLEAEDIARNMEKAVETARLNGSAVAIGHDRSVTVETLQEIVPRMEEKGIQFVTLSELARDRGD